MSASSAAPVLAKAPAARASQTPDPAARTESRKPAERRASVMPESLAAIPAEPPERPRRSATAPFFLQAKLAIGAVDDPLEREADAIADKVMRMPDPALSAPGLSVSSAPPQISRKCAACEKEEEKDRVLRMKPVDPATSGCVAPTISQEISQRPLVRRKCEKCEREEQERKLQRKSVGAGKTASAPPAIISDVINSPGLPLGATTRDFFEARFSRDFGQVRVRTDALAAQSARAIGARAYTIGNQIIFAAGEFSPGTSHGQRLLAHELAHVVQQAQGGEMKLRRTPDAAKACKTGHLLGSAELMPKDEIDVLVDLAGKNGKSEIEETFYYRVWGTWRTRDTLESFASRVLNAWVPWRFGPLAPEDSAKVFDYLFKSILERFGSGNGAEGCDYAIVLSRTEVAKLIDLSGESRRAQEREQARKTLAAAAEGKLDFAKATVAQRLVLLEDRIKLFWTGNEDEKQILEILKTTPQEQAAELSRRLSTDRVDDRSFADALDQVVDLGNNRELHEELTKLHLRGLGAKQGVESLLYEAPVLPWHDVMGVFAPVGGDSPATFSLAKTAGGKILVKYHQGFTLSKTSMPFQSEIDALPDQIKWSGVVYEPDQMLAVHDWDEGRFILVRARDLIAYEHIGVRNWLGHVATVASFAIPGGALSGTAAQVAFGVFKSALAAFTLFLQENRLSIMKWFPVWGPRMIYFADIAQLALTLYDIGAIAHSGAKFISAWRQARFARKLREAVNTVDEAEQVALRLEKEADKVFEAYDEARKVESAAGHVPGAKPSPADLESELGVKVGKSSQRASGDTAVREPPLAREPVDEGHHVEISKRGVELCSPPPCPLLNFEYAQELSKSRTLTKEMAEVDALRKAGKAEEAAKKAAPLQQTLEQFRKNSQLFQSVQARASFAQQQKLAEILSKAEKAGVKLDSQEFNELSKRLAAAKQFDEELVATEQHVEAVIELADAKAAKISPLADIPASLGFKPDFIKSFQSRATPAQQRRLTLLLEKAQRSGAILDRGVIDELSRRLSAAEDVEQELSDIERRLEHAIETHEESGQFNRPGRQKLLEPTDPTTVLRNKPGVARGGENLPAISGNWVQPERGAAAASANVDYRILPMPGQIAEKMRGRRFSNFDAFREEFWKLVAADKNLADDFNYNSKNLDRMSNGRAPIVPGKGLTGGVAQYAKGNFTYQIDHIRSLANGGGVYDLDNMHIVTWLAHVIIGE